MKNNPDTLSVSQRIRAIYPGQRYSHISISCLAAFPAASKLKSKRYICKELRDGVSCLLVLCIKRLSDPACTHKAQINSQTWQHKS